MYWEFYTAECWVLSSSFKSFAGHGLLANQLDPSKACF